MNTTDVSKISKLKEMCTNIEGRARSQAERKGMYEKIHGSKPLLSLDKFRGEHAIVLMFPKDRIAYVMGDETDIKVNVIGVISDDDSPITNELQAYDPATPFHMTLAEYEERFYEELSNAANK